MDPSAMVDHILEASGGAASRSELRAAGISKDWLTRHVGHGALQEVFPGVVATTAASREKRVRLRAALLFGGSGARLSHLTAAALLGLRRLRDEPLPVAMPHGRKRRCPPGLVLHQTVHSDTEVVDGFPVVPLAQTLVDLLEVLSLDDVRLVTADAVHRGRIRRSALTLDVRVPRRSAGRWRWILEELAAGAASGGEARYWRAIRESGLPLPELNAVVELDAGVAVVDALWRRYRLGVEIDGYTVHGGPAAFGLDRVRQNRLHLGSIMLIRFTVAQVLAEPGRCVDVTRTALHTRAEELRLPVRWRRRVGAGPARS